MAPKRQIPRLEAVTIHYEPAKSGLHRRVTLYDEDQTTPAMTFGKAHGLRLDGLDAQGRIQSRQWFNNPYLQEDQGRAMKLAAWRVKNRIDEVCFQPKVTPASLIELLSTLDIQVNPPPIGESI